MKKTPIKLEVEKTYKFKISQKFKSQIFTTHKHNNFFFIHSEIGLELKTFLHDKHRKNYYEEDITFNARIKKITSSNDWWVRIYIYDNSIEIL